MRREELTAAIAREELKLAQLRSELNERAARLVALHGELSSLSPAQTESLPSATPNPAAPAAMSNAEKVKLFRRLFCGREDVFARRWENRQTGRSGYSPACANEWTHGLCEKKKGAGRRVSCGECPTQAFSPVTDEEITKHLNGTHVMGVYPLLSNETCWFLAIDFDEGSWQDDIVAFVETCKGLGVPVAIERSRSGNGAHAWFFFTAPVEAASARKMGYFLLTETMTQRHQLSMESYDRLFPNQDTLPKGGFGNLIALPLQRQAREIGNSVFVDSALAPFADPWAFLASVQRLDPALIHALAAGARDRGDDIGVQVSGTLDPDARAPWHQAPSGRPPRAAITGPLPPVAHAVLSQRLFLEKTGLPSPLLSQVKRLAAFQNPEFYKRQSMRFSTALTPRVITCFEDLAEHIALPRGCLPEVEARLREHGVALAIDDRRENGAALDVTFRGSLTSVQEQAVRALLAHDTGILVAPSGMGKTVVGVYLVAARGRSSLVLVHRKPLLDQWVAQLSLFLDIESKDIGQIGAGKAKPNGRLDVAMLQSLVRKGQVSDLVAGYGHVIVDECHHCPCVSFERVLAETKARYVTGLTATPRRRDGHDPIMSMQLGPVRLSVDPKSQAARHPFEHKLVVRETGFQPPAVSDRAGIQGIYAALAADPKRNDLIFDDVVGALEEKRSPILLTERRDHLEHFAERLRAFTRHLIVLHGGMKPKERREVLARLAAIPDEEERLLLATGRYVGEGFDDARLDTLFLALPVSWRGTLVQYTGRLHRLHPGKVEVRIYDYVDRGVPMLARMFEKRLRGYRAIGYACDDTAPERHPGEGKIVEECDGHVPPTAAGS